MNRKQFRRHKQQFVSAFRAVLSQRGKNAELTEAAFCAYADPNPLIQFLFWNRVWAAIKFLESSGPYEAVLDFGCGGGAVLPLLTAFSKRVVGADINLAPYRALCEHLSFPNEIEMCETSKHPLSRFPDDSFDAIIALDVLEHVENLEDVFAQWSRISKKNGVVIFSGPTENLIYKIGRKIAGKEYTGDYHVRNIYDIHRIAKPFMEVEVVATLYYPFPLFKVFAGRIGSK